MSWWVHDMWNSGQKVLLVCIVVWVIGSIVLHELAHGWAAIRCGDRTPIELGHMTWNPIVHMGPFGLIMFAILGFAFGMMPVNPSRMRGRHAEALVALAGPAMNLALAVAALVLGMLWMGVAGGHWIPSVKADEPFFSNMLTFFRAGLWLNVLLMVFNLVPIPPLDGSRIFGHYCRPYREFFDSEQGTWVGWGLFILLFFFGADYILSFSASKTFQAWDAIESLLGLA